MKLILVRHGNGFHNETELLNHPSLTMLGKIQARMAARSILEYLEANKPTNARVHMHVSPSVRTIQTCDIIFDMLFDNGMHPNIYSVHEGLMERFESDTDISLTDQEMFELVQMLEFTFIDHFDKIVQKNKARKRGESHATVQKHILAFLKRIDEQEFDKNDYHILVSHSGTLSAFLHDYTTKSEKSNRKPEFRVLQGEVIFVEYEPSTKLVPKRLTNMQCLSEENGHLNSYKKMSELKARWKKLRKK